MSNETMNVVKSTVVELNDERSSALLFAESTSLIFDTLVSDFVDFKVSKRYEEYFKSKVAELDDLKQRIKQDFEDSYHLTFENYEFHPLDKKGILKSAVK